MRKPPALDFIQVASMLFDRGNLASGMRVLDYAAGPLEASLEPVDRPGGGIVPIN